MNSGDWNSTHWSFNRDAKTPASHPAASLCIVGERCKAFPVNVFVSLCIAIQQHAMSKNGVRRISMASSAGIGQTLLNVFISQCIAIQQYAMSKNGVKEDQHGFLCRSWTDSAISGNRAFTRT